MRTRLILFFFLLPYIGFAQKVAVVFTSLKKTDTIQWFTFQDTFVSSVSDTVNLELNNKYSASGILIIKINAGYLISDLSKFYQKQNTRDEPIEFTFYRMNSIEYRSAVFTMKGADVFWDCRLLEKINVHYKGKKRKRWYRTKW